MPAPEENAQRLQVQPRGVISTALHLPLHVLSLLGASLLLSVVIELAGMLWVWPEQGWRHSQQMLQAEMGWLSEHFKTSLLVQQPGQTVEQLLDLLEQWLLIDSGFADFARQAQTTSTENGLRGLISQLYLAIEDGVLATVYVTFTCVVRLIILLLAAPLFLLAMLTGMVDGLVQRDLRRFGAGRESSFVYHRARGAILPLLIAPWLIYLALPFSLNPIFVLLPCAVLLGVAVAITASTFKKYL